MIACLAVVVVAAYASAPVVLLVAYAGLPVSEDSEHQPEMAVWNKPQR